MVNTFLRPAYGERQKNILFVYNKFVARAILPALQVFFEIFLLLTQQYYTKTAQNPFISL